MMVEYSLKGGRAYLLSREGFTQVEEGIYSNVKTLLSQSIAI
ncbi:hypothetical protein HMPREF0973_00413 [Prevotella veroralis F0319]|uniref:Uncharacterized protein n=1 Tax=Prevotella veroralis F0319 TaxID=649761 RepID=C9MLD8_9BACT|nr:hypothetical protein HMPREF0973_00413 [Prevotella veroralis F0319]